MSSTAEGYLRHDVDPAIRHLVTERPRSAAQTLRLLVFSASATLGLLALGIAVATHFGRMPWDPIYRTDWTLLALLVGMGPYGVFYARDLKRIRAIDDHFPDFLRDLAESARGGMTLPRALSSAAKGQYGALTPEIQRMSHQVEWGISFSDAFDRFSERARSPLIRRTVNLIQEARRSGGNVVDVLSAAAEDAREIKQIVVQRQNQMAAYTTVVYVTFGVFLGVMLLLQIQLVPAFQKAAIAAGGTVRVGGINFNATDSRLLNETFFHAALIQAFTGGLVSGLLRRGHVAAGLTPIAVMGGLAWFCFRIVAGG